MDKKMFRRKKMTMYLIVFLLGFMTFYFFKSNEYLQNPTENGRVSTKKEIEVYPIPPDALEQLPKVEREVFIEKKMQERSDFIKSYNKPIEYHGQILDQFNKPVVGASVFVDIGIWKSLSYRPTTKKLRVTSDANGKFSIQGEKGLDLHIESLTKTGYTFQYVEALNFRGGRRTTTSLEQPVIIRAYKIKGVPEKLLIGNVRFHQLKPDGRMYSIDLISGKKQEGRAPGQIRVAYNYTGGTSGTLPTNWAVSLEANGGGLIMTTDALMFEAPETGYQQKWMTSFKLGSPEWKRELKRKFYLKAQNGKVYGRLEIEFLPFFNVEKSDTYIGIKYWLNQEGSRNLYSTKQPF